MKIEIDEKEFITLLAYLKTQKEPICTVKDFADAILQNVPSKSSVKYIKDECGYSITTPIESSHIKWKL